MSLKSITTSSLKALYIVAVSVAMVVGIDLMPAKHYAGPKYGPTTWELWVKRHTPLQSNDAFSIASDGRYKVKFRQQYILLPSTLFGEGCNVYYWILDDDGTPSTGVLAYNYVVDHPAILRALLSDALSVDFQFGNNPSSLQKFLGVYAAAKIPYIDHLDISLSINDAALSWPSDAGEGFPALNGMALGLPPFDEYGFSKVGIHGFDWYDPNATLLVASLNDIIDAYGRPLFFICDSRTCLLSTKINTPIGATQTSYGFHISRYVRFSAGILNIHQEQALTTQFRLVLDIVSQMIKNK